MIKFQSKKKQTCCIVSLENKGINYFQMIFIGKMREFWAKL